MSRRVLRWGRESVQVTKRRTIGVNGEHRPTAIPYCAFERIASITGRPIQGVFGQNQTGSRKSSVVDASETTQGREPHALGVDGDPRAPASTAAMSRRPIQGIAR